MNYHWIGHCREGTSDKIWGLICLSADAANNPWTRHSYVSFWGRRGKKLQTKIHQNLDYYDADRLVDKKEARGYNVIDVNRLDRVYPEFEQDLEATAVWALLKV